MKLKLYEIANFPFSSKISTFCILKAILKTIIILALQFSSKSFKIIRKIWLGYGEIDLFILFLVVYNRSFQKYPSDGA
jgi:hypothetical protein